MLGQPDNLIYYADGNTSNDHWYLKDSFARNSLPIPHYLDNYKIQSLFNLVLPYFRNIKMETLVKILDEESDTLSPLRRELKRIVLNYAENDLEEVRQNILRPEIDTINRKFKNYKSAHKLRIVGSVGLFSVSLIKVFVSNENLPDFISSIMSGAGVSGIFLSERKYQEDINSLRDSPYFLLWKIKRQPRL
jgi:hypothetical protein